MPSNRWSQVSLNALEEIDPRLVAVIEEVRDLVDITIVSGYRSLEEQLQLYERGFSKVKSGKHNVYPSLAVDVQPYPLPHAQQDLREELSYIAGLFIAFGRKRGLTLRWGGDWDRDSRSRNNNFDDLYHIEIV